MGIQLARKREEAQNEKDRERLTGEEVEREIYHSLMSPPSVFIVLGPSAFCIMLDTLRHHSINTGIAESSGTGSGPDSRELGCPKTLLWLFITN